MKAKLQQFFSDRSRVYFILIFLLGVAVRVFEFGTLPCGLNQDEAFAGYEAFSIANYGVDASGYHNPVYFTAWGSGMNVLESYLAIPFIKLFGLSVYTIRLPQLLCSLASLPVTYLLLNELTGNRRLGLVGMGILAISPWHIMISRWALESNLAPAFLLFGLYFFVKGIRKNKYFIFSALFYGLTLYSYATTWVVVPLTVFFCGLYLLLTKQKLSFRYISISAAVLFVLALPLILFVLINNGYMNEISTRFISIPKMLVMRADEIHLSNLWEPQSYHDLFSLMLEQNDGLLWNSSEFGFFYMFSIPFTLAGAVKLTVQTVKGFKRKAYEPHTILWISLVCSIITVLILDNKNINRVNIILMNVLICTAVGLEALFSFFAEKNYKLPKQALIAAYALSFIFFLSYYFGSFNTSIAAPFRSGVEEAVEFVNDNEFKNINVDSQIYYPQILFYDCTPTDEFLETVKYTNYPARYLKAKSFTKYTFGVNYSAPDPAFDCYIIQASQKKAFTDRGYTVAEFDQYAVAFLP